MKPTRSKANRSRLKPPLSVDQQIQLLGNYSQSDPDFGQALIAFFLSTGTHPCVLAFPDRYNLMLSRDYYTYLRPKTYTPISFPWSQYIRDHGIHELINERLNKSIQWYAQETARYGQHIGIPERVAPLRCRHEMFRNLARLGYDPYFIMHRAGTDINTIGKFYTVGHTEMETLDPWKIHWLKGLMSP